MDTAHYQEEEKQHISVGPRYNSESLPQLKASAPSLPVDPGIQGRGGRGAQIIQLLLQLREQEELQPDGSPGTLQVHAALY